MGESVLAMACTAEVVPTPLLLLYADDTIIMVESATELYDSFNVISHYCKLWSLKRNTTKHNILVFSMGNTFNIPTLYFNGTYLDVCFDYVHIDVNMNCNAMFVLTKQKQYRQTQKAMNSLIEKSGMELCALC